MKEIYLDEKQIEEVVIKYLDNHTYNYALMIDGSWGTGKTFFVKNDLIPLIEKNKKESDPKNKILYVSLYGIESCEEISRLLYVELRHQVISKKDSAIKKWIGSGAKVVADVFKESKGIDFEKITETMWDGLLFKNTIMIFDDLERCSCNIIDVLGYINNFVEHDSVKVLLIANEQEINTATHLDNNPLEFLVCLQKNIDFLGENNGNEKNNSITISELNERVGKLFKRNQSYEHIKEKVVGETIKYKPNFCNKLVELINKYVDDEKIKELLLKKIDAFERISWQYNHYNLRTFLFFISKYSELKSHFSNHMDILEEILDYTYYVCIMVKSGYKLPSWGTTLNGKISIFDNNGESVLGFKFIDEFVKYGKINKKEVNEVVSQYIAYEKEREEYKNDPINVLENWYLMEDKEVEKHLEKMYENLKNEQYICSMYPRILKYYFDLSSIGFKKDYIDESINIMKKNIIDLKWTKLLKNRFFSKSENDNEREYEEKIEYLNQLIKKNQMEEKDFHLNCMLCNELTWGKEFYDYVLKYENDAVEDIEFINKIDIDKLINIINRSNSKNIDLFRIALCKMYKYSNIDELYMDDYENLYLLYKSLDENGNYGITKKCNIRWLKKSLKDIILSLDKERFNTEE